MLGGWIVDQLYEVCSRSIWLSSRHCGSGMFNVKYRSSVRVEVSQLARVRSHTHTRTHSCTHRHLRELLRINVHTLTYVQTYKYIVHTLTHTYTQCTGARTYRGLAAASKYVTQRTNEPRHVRLVHCVLGHPILCRTRRPPPAPPPPGVDHEAFWCGGRSRSKCACDFKSVWIQR